MAPKSGILLKSITLLIRTTRWDRWHHQVYQEVSSGKVVIESAQQFIKVADQLCSITGYKLSFESLWCILFNKLVSFLHGNQDCGDKFTLQPEGI